MAAYTSVTARRQLGQPAFVGSGVYTGHPLYAVPPPPPPPPPPAISYAQVAAPAPKKIDWPGPVREYVQRAFADVNDIPGITRDEMQARLKVVINDAAARDALNFIDWANLPLPQQMIQQDRINAVTAAAAAVAARNMQPPPWLNPVSHGLTRITPSANVLSTHTSKKRKSSEMSNNDIATEDAAHPPWRDSSARNDFEDRITYSTPAKLSKAEKRQRRLQEEFSSNTLSSKSSGNLERRKQRFESGNTPTHLSSRDDSPASEATAGPVIGTCQKLEKQYFRLTSAPKPESVRPQPVLEKTLDLLKSRWRKENNYSYICDQFKSMRQDLTVQHIKNEFTVAVYEIHARIALEKGDLGEYNQCQTQLRALYMQKLGGHPAEFLAYRILYFIHTCNRTDMSDLLADLTAADKEEAAVKHALAVRSALALGNYHRFFRLYLDTPNMGGYLMDMFIVRERLVGLANMCRAYKPDVPVRFVTEELGFESDLECVQFLTDHGGAALLDDSKGDGPHFLTGKAGALFETAKQAAFRRVDIKGQI